MNVAHEKLLGDLAPVANDLSEFTFGFAKAIFQKYINRDELVIISWRRSRMHQTSTMRACPTTSRTPGLREA